MPNNANGSEARSSAEDRGQQIHMENEEKQPTGAVTHMEAGFVDLATAAALQKPKFWSMSMLRLYLVMTVGYLVSTIQGYGKS